MNKPYVLITSEKDKKLFKKKLKKSIINIMRKAVILGIYQKEEDGVYFLDLLKQVEKSIFTPNQIEKPQYFREEFSQITRLVQEALLDLSEEDKIEEMFFTNGIIAYSLKGMPYLEPNTFKNTFTQLF